MNNDEELQVSLARILSEILADEVDPEAHDADLTKVYGADSMDLVDAVVAIEEQLGVRISNKQVESIRTFGDVCSLVKANTRTAG